MHQGPDGPGKSDRRATVGFGKFAYDPVNQTFWYYGIGVAADQGGSAISWTNFGTKSLDDFCNMLKYHLREAQPTIEQLTTDKLNGK